MPCHQETSQRILGTYLDSHTLTPVSPRFLHYARISSLHYSTGGANRLPPNDNIVDPYIVQRIAGKAFHQLEHHLVDDNHYLHNIFETLDWPKLLQSD